MIAYEQQILNSENYYDQAIKQLEAEDINILESYITTNNLHEKINNTVVEGIDEG